MASTSTFKDDGDEGDRSFLADVEDVVTEIKSFVTEAHVLHSDQDAQIATFKVVTLEGQELLIELSAQGYKVTNMQTALGCDRFETIYALLDHHSTQFRSEFCNSLASKLSALEKA